MRMTNFEFVKTIDSEEGFLNWLKNTLHGRCYMEDKTIEYCSQFTCRECRVRFLKEEMKL